MTHVIQGSRSHRRRLGAGAWYLGTDGTAIKVSFGSHTSLDDLPTAALTIEYWARINSATPAWAVTLSKHSGGLGWYATITNTLVLRLSITHAVQMTRAATTTPVCDGQWRHYAWTFDPGGDKKARAWVHGALESTAADAADGAYDADAAHNLVFGSTNNVQDGLGWIRLSNTIRYTANFDPPRRTEPPAVDANTIEQWNMDDGGGTTTTAQVSANNNGTISNGVWRYG